MSRLLRRAVLSHLVLQRHVLSYYVLSLSHRIILLCVVPSSLPQECGVVPATPFPEPTIGKAAARWNNVRDIAIPAINNPTASNSATPGLTGTRKKLRGMNQIAEAVLKARQANKHAEDSAGVTSSGEEEGIPQDMGEIDDLQMPEDKPELLRGCPASRSQLKNRRQESYYLRGVVEEHKDKALLSTIANCIPGDFVFVYLFYLSAAQCCFRVCIVV